MAERALFLFLVALHAVPIWLVPYPPSCDGPAHLETAHLLAYRGAAGYETAREHVAVSRDPTRQWLPAIVLAALIRVVGPLPALKLFMTGYVLLFPLALRYAVDDGRPASRWVVYAGFTLIYNRLFLFGFFGFLYGLVVLLFTFGWWRRQPRDTRSLWVLTGLGLLLPLAHVFSLAAALLVFTPLAIGEVLHRRRSEAVVDALAGLHAFIPGLVFAAGYLIPRLEVRYGAAREGCLGVIASLFRGVPLTSYGNSRVERVLAVAALLIVLSATVVTAVQAWRSRRFVATDGLLAAGVAWAVLWACAPNAIAHGSFLRERCALYLLVTLLLWAGGRTLPGARVVAGAAITISVGMLGLHAVRFHQVSREVEQYVAASGAVAPGGAILPLRLEAPRFEVPLLDHVASYVAVARRGINVGNYQPGTDHFPLVLRARYRPTDPLPPGPWEALSLCGLDRAFLTWAAAGDERAPDYILLSTGGESDRAAEIAAALRAHYQPANGASTHASLIVFRKRTHTEGPPPL